MTFQQAYAKYRAHIIDNEITGLNDVYICEKASATDGQGAWRLVDIEGYTRAYVDKHGVTIL
jgi:hypothetical protein